MHCNYKFNYDMKNLNLKRVVLNPVFSSANGKSKGNSTLNCEIDDNQSILNVVIQLTALMLTLPAITALLLVWFNIK